MDDSDDLTILLDVMCIGDRSKNPADNVRNYVEIERLTRDLLRDFAKIHPVRELHRHLEQIFLYSDVEHQSDRPVDQQRPHPRLSHEHSLVAEILRGVACDQLDRDRLAHVTNLGAADALPYLRHSSLAELGDKLVLSDVAHGDSVASGDV